MGTHCDKWQWLSLIASKHGPRDATTRHVCHVLALHMNQHGGNAWPSQAHLAMRSRLSERAVRTHLKKAEKAGWLTVYPKWRKGHGWKLHEYQASVPTEIEAEISAHPWEEDPTWQRPEPRSGSSDVGQPLAAVTNGQRPEPDAQRPERGSTTCGTSRPNVRNDVPTNYPLTLPINSSEEGALASEHTTQGFKKFGEGEKSPEPSANRQQGIGKAAKMFGEEKGDYELARLSGTTADEVAAWRAA